MANQRGVCAVRAGGVVLSVTVEDAYQIRTTKNPAQYFEEGIQPPIDSLPDCPSCVG